MYLPQKWYLFSFQVLKIAVIEAIRLNSLHSKKELVIV